MLKSIYDNYARIATSQINGLFRVASEVEVIGVEEQRYYEFGNALNETDVITLAKAELQDHSKNPPMVFHISPILMGSMIDRLLGGTGTDTEVDGSYVYTDIEIALYESVIKHLIAITKDVWSTYIHMDVEFGWVEENPSMFQGISVDETVVIVMLRISLGENIEGAMNICLPGTLLFNIFDIIEKTKHLADKDNSHMQRDNREEILESIKESEMEVMAQLGVARLNLDDIYNLHVGDVIDLNKPQDSAVSVHVALPEPSKVCASHRPLRSASHHKGKPVSAVFPLLWSTFSRRLPLYQPPLQIRDSPAFWEAYQAHHCQFLAASDRRPYG